MTTLPRVLVAHSAYSKRQPSGENKAFEQETAVLRKLGVELETYTVSSDEVFSSGARTLVSALRVPWNRPAAAAFSEVLNAFKPDIVHFHNLFPNLSPSVLPAARASGAGIVMTLHNYRVFCAKSTAFRGGQPCFDCRGRTPWPAVRHACYRNNPLASAMAAGFVQQLQRQLHCVDQFLVVSTAQRQQIEGLGIAPQAITIKPNMLAMETRPGPLPWAERSRDCIFVGRLDEEKGILMLLDAWTAMGSSAPKLDIAGSGPLLNTVRARIEASENLRQRVAIHGMLTHVAALDLMAQAKLLLCPSLWHETFGFSVIEAAALGVGALTTAGRGPDDFVLDGRTGQRLDCSVSSWAGRISQLFAGDLDELRAWASNAPFLVGDRHEPETNMRELIRIYGEVQARALRRDQP